MSQLTSPQLLFTHHKLYSIANPTQPNANLGIIGQPQSKVAIVFNYPQAQALVGEERTQLVNILAACKLTEADVVFVNTAFIPHFTISTLRQLYPLTTLIQFGNFDLTPNLNLPRHVCYTIDNLRFIKTESLPTIMNDKALKGLFWAQLRTLFGV